MNVSDYLIKIRKAGRDIIWLIEFQKGSYDDISTRMKQYFHSASYRYPNTEIYCLLVMIESTDKVIDREFSYRVSDKAFFSFGYEIIKVWELDALKLVEEVNNHGNRYLQNLH